MINLLSLASRPIEAKAESAAKSVSVSTFSLLGYDLGKTLTECPMEINLSFSEVID
jgi:hypothetical protein